MKTEDPTALLVELGLNELEARVYADLLREPRSTGYRVAKTLGKPAANVYKALESLESKGAVVVEDGTSRRFQPVPADEFLDRLERRFTRRRRAAAEALAHLPGPSGDDRIYQVRSADEVLDRCRRMISAAHRIVLLDIFPEPLEELRPEIEAAVTRGVEVVTKVYAPVELPGARVVLEPEYEDLRARWKGSWLAAYVDGTGVLYGVLSADLREVVYSVWSGSPHLGSVLTFGFAFEVAYTALKQQFVRGADLETLRSRFLANERYFAERIRPLAADRQWYAHDDGEVNS